jgi:hypothetical protein
MSPPLINTFGSGSARAFGFAALKNTASGGWIRAETTVSNTIGLGIEVTSAGIFVAERAFSFTGTTNGVMKLTTAGAITFNKNFTYNTGNGKAWDVGLDSSGNIYLLVHSGLQGVVKLDSSGNFTYFRQISNTYYNWGVTTQINSRGLWVDSSGSNLYICGQTTSTTASSLGVISSVTQSGSAVNWSRTSGTASATSNARCVTSDTSGNVYVGLGSASFFGIVKYNSSGTIQWARAGNTPLCAITDASGIIYTGNVAGQVTAFNPTTGATLWATTYTMQQYDIALDSAGNIYVVGRINTVPSPSIIMKYNSSGTFQWAREFRVILSGTTIASIIYAVSIDNTNSRICFTGGATSANNTESACPFFVAAFPTDGSGTGSYTIGSYTYTYAVYAASAQSNITFSGVTVTPTNVSPTYTNTGNINNVGTNTISTTLTSFA